MEQTTYNAETQRALERVRKMLALANDAAASEGERDNALRMAHATLAKYNLSLAEANDKTDDRGKKELALRAPPWARVVAHSVAQLFFCEYFFSRMRGDQRIRHFFIGREANAVTAMEIAAFVIRSIQGESGRRRKELGEDGLWQTAFIKGAAHKVHARCAELRRQAEQASQLNPQGSTGTSVVLASVYRTEMEANKALLPALRHSKSRERHVGRFDGYVHGSKYGEGISLNRQVGGKAKPTPSKLLK